MKPNEEPLHPFFDNALSSNQCLKISPSLQVHGFDNIFALGDIIDLKIPKVFYLIIFYLFLINFLL